MGRNIFAGNLFFSIGEAVLRQRLVKDVIDEVITLRRVGFRFIDLADDNFYPVTLRDLNQASQQQDKRRSEQLSSPMADRRSLMVQLSRIPAPRSHSVHSDHNGSSRESRFPEIDAVSAHRGRFGWCRIGHGRGAKKHL
jgi:hypothetical protein